MLKTDEDALICDFVETYGVFDWRSLPLRLAATLAAGLPDTSRSVRKLSGMEHPFERYLLAGIYDALRVANWQRTKDATTGKNKPDLIMPKLLRTEKSEGAVMSYTDGDAFMRAREALLNGGS